MSVRPIAAVFACIREVTGADGTYYKIRVNNRRLTSFAGGSSGGTLARVFLDKRWVESGRLQLLRPPT